VLEELEDGRDAGMIEPRDGDGFRAEAFGDLGIVQLGVEDFNRDFAMQRLVNGLVDRAHTATADTVEDAVFADVLTNHSTSLEASGEEIAV
jgi:hypothetical protein